MKFVVIKHGTDSLENTAPGQLHMPSLHTAHNRTSMFIYTLTLYLIQLDRQAVKQCVTYWLFRLAYFAAGYVYPVEATVPTLSINLTRTPHSVDSQIDFHLPHLGL